MEIHTCKCVPLQSKSHSEKVKGWLCFIFSVVLHFTECFKQKDSVMNTSAITAVTKSSMKPWSHEAALLQIVTYAVVKKEMESKGEQR